MILKPSKNTAPIIYEIQGTNPFLNLSVEDWIFRSPFTHPCLLLWRNDRSVVIGRGQNPWQEANLAYLEQENIPLVRRQTGGGTVYHDLGNLNISLLMPGAALEKNTLITLLLQALQNLGLKDLESNERGDIKLQGKKIVGSAYRVTQKATLHHVCLLFNANVEQLKLALSSPHLITGRSVASVRSEVTTLKQAYPDLKFSELTWAITQAFFKHFNACPTSPFLLNTQEVLAQEPSLQATYEEYQTWAWRFGKTPPFSITSTDPLSGEPLTTEVEKGCIKGSSIPFLSV